jgi:hypothetical protein
MLVCYYLKLGEITENLVIRNRPRDFHQQSPTYYKEREKLLDHDVIIHFGKNENEIEVKNVK